MFRQLFLFLTVTATGLAQAQSYQSENVLTLDEGSTGGQATLEDIAWLAGSWEGEAFGGTFEEVWTPAHGGTMAGLFKLIHGDAPSLYEIQTISEEDGTLVWKVKHFNRDFSAWEDKTEHVAFRLVKIDSSGAYFDGITIKKDGPNLVGYLMVGAEGNATEEKIVYRPSSLRN